ncbi:GNAT family N-acetyltransferase [Streptomyces sp. AS02]|nr:GNAT family N-acetyltransferase [Streptomyces sp. AS02]
MTVDPAVQNRGTGRRLMQDVMDRATERGAPGIRLLQSGYHNRSFSLHAGLGFVFRETVACMQGQAILREMPGHPVRGATDADLRACADLAFSAHAVAETTPDLQALMASVPAFGGPGIVPPSILDLSLLISSHLY